MTKAHQSRDSESDVELDVDRLIFEETLSASAAPCISNARHLWALYRGSYMSSEEPEGIYAIRTRYREIVPVAFEMPRRLQRLLLKNEFFFSARQCRHEILTKK